MFSTVIIENVYPSLQIIWKVFELVLISLTVRICISIIKFEIWRRKISKTLPGTKMRFFNILGNFSELPLTEQSRSGQSILVHAQQLLQGHAKLLKLEKLYSLWVFFYPLVVLSKAEAVEAIFSGKKTIDKPFPYRWLEAFLGNGVLTSSGNDWKSQRRLLTPCFRSDVLKKHLQIMNEQSQVLVTRLKGETEKDVTLIAKYLSDCAFDIMCGTIYGVNMGTQESKKETEPFVSSTNKGFKLLGKRFLNIFLWFDFLFYSSKIGKEVAKHSQITRDFMRNLFDKEWQKICNHLQTKEKKENSLIKLLMRKYYLSKDMNEEEIRDQLMTFMIAGHDTSKIALKWILYMLGLYPDVQAKVHEELDLIFGDDLERHVTVDDLKNMNYLDRVIKETLRLYPPANFFGRYFNEDITICGYRIPKGTTCFVVPYVLHRDEKVFPNPEKFDPDRFLPDNFATVHPYAYIPFSAGPRNCIGKHLAIMELLTVTSTILRQFTVQSLDPRDQVLPMLSMALSSSMPIRIRIRPRHSRDA